MEASEGYSRRTQLHRDVLTRRYSTDSRGISVGGVVGGVFGCLLAIAGAVILYKTWRVLEVKRVGRNHKELVMLGGGMTARAKPTTTGTDDLMLLCCSGQARPRLPRLEPPWHSSVSKSSWRSSRSVYAHVWLRLNARCVHARVCAHAIKRAPLLVPKVAHIGTHLLPRR